MRSDDGGMERPDGTPSRPSRGIGEGRDEPEGLRGLDDLRLRAALGDLVSGVAHEIRNPINTISLTSQVVQKLFDKKGLDFEEFREYFRIIHFELGKMKKIIDNFVKFSRVPDLRIEPFELTDLLKTLADQLRPDLGERGIGLGLATSPSIRVEADRDQLAEALLNIVQNSVQSLGDGGEIRIEAFADDSSKCRLTIFDDGPGLRAEDSDRIFHPYYTTVPGGLGLGLTLSRSIIESHGGAIRAGSRPEGGAEFVIELPLSAGGEQNHG